MDAPRTKWWGWGLDSLEVSIESRPGVWSAIREALGPTGGGRWPVPSPDEIPLAPPIVSTLDVEAFRGVVGSDRVSTDHRVRLSHAVG